jgi:quinol-cytochrome oxidoreductase complex cytochrome b subunit
MEKALGWLLGAAAAEVAVLAVTGVFLVFFYQPSAANAWGDVRHLGTAVTFTYLVRIVHRLTASLMVLTMVAMAGIAVTMAVARWLRARPAPEATNRARPAPAAINSAYRHSAIAVAAVGVAVVGLFASFTGYLLPWDQLSLWAVTVGRDMNGFLPILRHSSQVQYALIGGAEISVGTLRFWFWVHVLLVPAVLLGLGGLVGRRLWVSRRLDEPDGHTGLGS